MNHHRLTRELPAETSSRRGISLERKKETAKAIRLSFVEFASYPIYIEHILNGLSKARSLIGNFSAG
jgi:hypothetical protein